MTKASKSIMVLLCGALLGACAPSVKAPPVTRAPAGLGAEDAASATDPNAMRLQDISAALLLYFARHKELPRTLEDLRPLAGADLQLTSPTTGQPYVYVRSGLAVPEQERLLVVYESAAGPEGWRWGIVASPPEGNRPLTMLVVRLSEPVLKAYLQSAGPANK